MRLVAVGNYYGAHKPYMDMFKDFALLHIGSDVDSFLKEGDVVLFGGGEDISPTIYQQKPSRYSGASVDLSLRDKFEVVVYTTALARGIPMIGICRGAQLICALAGGSLYQHVDSHGTSHYMTTNEDEEIYVSSVHHQMMNPINTEHELLAWSSDVRSHVHLVEGEIDMDAEVEPEVVWFNNVKALAIQYHPEFMDFNSRGVTYARELVDKLILKGG